MFRHDFVVVLAVLAAGTARAEPAALSNAADPARKSPPVAYVSPFEGYRPFQVLPTQPWAESNERVRAVGGQMGVLRDGGDGATAKPQPEGKP